MSCLANALRAIAATAARAKTGIATATHGIYVLVVVVFGKIRYVEVDVEEKLVEKMCVAVKSSKSRPFIATNWGCKCVRFLPSYMPRFIGS